MPAPIPDKVFFRIGEVSRILGVKAYVLRYWETEFPMVAPQKTRTNQRVYRRSEVETLLMIKRLLHEERYSIEGARKKLKGLRGAKAEASRLSAECRAELKGLTRELQELAREPISRLFRQR